MLLNRKNKYLQIAFNSSIFEVEKMINDLPQTDKIIIEAGTSFLKQYGMPGLSKISNLWRNKIGKGAYVVADMKCMDRGGTEVQAVSKAGASAVTCLGLAPIETIDDFIRNCSLAGIDSMIDMLNVNFPFEILQKLKKQPNIVILHRGVDEGEETKKQIPYHDINRIKSAYNTVISVAGGEDARDARRAFFNGADISIVWREINNEPENTAVIVNKFLASIKGYAKTRK